MIPMTNFGEPQPGASERPSGIYLKLASKTDVPTVVEDSDMKHFTYPARQISHVGDAQLALSAAKYDDSATDDQTVTVIDSSGIKPMKRKAARDNGYFKLDVEITNPESRIRNIESRAILSLDGQTDSYVSTVDNLTQDTEETGAPEVEETKFLTFRWKDTETDEAQDIMIPNDPDLLSTFGFRFEFLQKEVARN